MIIPKYLKEGGTIGIVAPSDGLADEKYQKAALKAIKRLESLGYKVKLSDSCFKSKNGRSNSAKVRAKEFLKMYFDEHVDILLSISGGEYGMEILPYLPLKKLKKNPKLFCGYSDNSLLDFVLLTNLEMVNIYGHNLYELVHDHPVIDNYLESLKGNILPQEEINNVSKKDYDYANKVIKKDYQIDAVNEWKVYNSKKIDVTGIIIGGLIDDLTIICGTKYDKVKRFLKKYKKEGFIWYLDLCLVSPEEAKRILFQLKNAGWFSYTKAIIVGIPIIQDTSFGITYQDNMFDELKELNIPVIFDVNISHIPPSYHAINGLKINLKYNHGHGVIKYIKEE